MTYSLLSIAKLAEHALLRPPVILAMLMLDFGEQEIYEIEEDEELGITNTSAVSPFTASLLANSPVLNNDPTSPYSTAPPFTTTISMLLWSIDLTENTWVKTVHRWCRLS
jgi:hypothetical protein